MKQDRLFSIIYYLLANKNVTAKQLADKFEVSVRTIYRDIDTLSGAGIPIYSETGRNGGVRLMDGYALDKTALSKTEKDDILTALRGISSMGSIGLDNTISKLTALFNSKSQNWYEIDFSGWGYMKNTSNTFEIIRDAIINNNSLLISYVGNYETENERKIYPLKLVYKLKAWYVQAFCTKRNDYRLFKLSRVINIKVLDEKFDQMECPSMINSSKPKSIDVKLIFEKKIASRVYDDFDISCVKRLENEDLLVKTSFPEGEWLYEYILSYGTNVTVLNPPSVIERIIEKSKNISKKYKT